MRCLLIAAGLLLSACAAPLAVAPQPAAALAAAAAYAPVSPEPSILPPPTNFQALLDAHDVALRTPAVGKAIIVNIPSFEVVALQDGVEVMRSRAIVGKTAQRTPLMDTTTTVVRFRPHWRPTPSMIASGAYEDKLVPPGRGNPLGVAAIRLAQGELIYLHGTNRPELFARDRRALSWGCVRVERLEPLLAWLLDADAAQIAAWTGGRRTFDVQTAGVPLIITHQTRFPDADGVMRDWPDVYGYGAARVASR